MDSVYKLLRTVVRGFYDQKSVIVYECILVHHVLSDRELRNASGIAIKDIRAICARLKEDHLLKEVSHRDESGFRAYTHTVYFVHFTEAVDAVKWKMFTIETKLREELNHRHNAQDYVCDKCGMHYETIDALTLFDPITQQFNCEVCGSALREHNPSDISAGVDENNDKKEQGNHMETFMIQLKPVLTTLKMIDETTIPENSLETELQKQLPLIGFENTSSQAYNLPPHLSGSMAKLSSNMNDSGITIAGSANSRLPQQQQSTFHINITSEAEQQSQLAVQQLEKEKLAEENVLPEWHAKSTVSMDIPSNISEKDSKNEAADSKDPKNEDVSVATSESAMEAYFKRLQEQQEAMPLEGDEGDEDEDEFEDVV